ncbi:glycosyltransferase [Jejudonia soesokkakensis]|uniref:Glycosyltransferase n=1 Tax=Jejudonia soesokkakensis TaxID=1323432 RepID=A0ABW2MPN7_9FLAO
MIPKKLHYCWFGGGPKPISFHKCLESWKHFCPDFEIIEWNETNAPNKGQAFYKNALRKQQYAFVADTVRAEVLYIHGGIYLDTDMLLLKPLDLLLPYQFFSGEEVAGRVAYGLWGATPKHRFLKAMKSFYDTAYFNEFSPPVITHAFKDLVQQENLKSNEVIFPPEIFYPIPYENRAAAYSSFITDATMAVHLWDHSWNITKEETKGTLLKKITTVCSDYLFYGYPTPYLKRYAKEFGRKLYHKIFT